MKKENFIKICIDAIEKGQSLAAMHQLLALIAKQNSLRLNKATEFRICINILNESVLWN